MKNVKIIKNQEVVLSSEIENKPYIITKKQRLFNILVQLYLVLINFFLEIFSVK